MHEPTDSPWQVPFDGSFSLPSSPTGPGDDGPKKKKLKKELAKLTEEIAELQRVLYADNKHSLLLVFQAMDAAGKDGTIRAVMSGVNPAGCQVFSFKQPSDNELDHDFLWRTAKSLPERGRIGIYNRSYYEEVLVVRVHPEYLGGQRLPKMPPLEQLWSERFDSIREHEKHLARNGTVVLKFWLNVGKDEQKARFLARIDEPEKNWKFSGGDVKERGHWDEYMAAYADLLDETSRPWAPWYAIPADDKPFMRVQVATIVRDALRSLGLKYPELEEEDRSELGAMKAKLEAE
jgi:PPK2 family polyphosphate:nucleotide phosphotransferase